MKISDYAISAYKNGTIEINGTKSNGFISYVTKDWGAGMSLMAKICQAASGSLSTMPGHGMLKRNL